MGQLQEKYKNYREPQKFMEADVYPYFRAIEGKQGTEVEMGGHKVLMFGSNAYTGLTGDQRIIEAAKAAGFLAGGVKYIAAAVAVGLACIAGGMAVGKIGSAAMGAMSENPELSGKALPFVGLAEGICLWGMLVAVLILIL